MLLEPTTLHLHHVFVLLCGPSCKIRTMNSTENTTSLVCFHHSCDVFSARNCRRVLMYLCVRLASVMLRANRSVCCACCTLLSRLFLVTKVRVNMPLMSPATQSTRIQPRQISRMRVHHTDTRVPIDWHEKRRCDCLPIFKALLPRPRTTTSITTITTIVVLGVVVIKHVSKILQGGVALQF